MDTSSAEMTICARLDRLAQAPALQFGPPDFVIADNVRTLTPMSVNVYDLCRKTPL